MGLHGFIFHDIPFKSRSVYIQRSWRVNFLLYLIRHCVSERVEVQLHGFFTSAIDNDELQ
jgi:hypothetical protein